MNLPGLLIEYLINGSIALIWIFWFVDISVIEGYLDDQKLIIIPIAYVIGMFIDFIAWMVTKPLKKHIRENALGVIAKEMENRGLLFDADAYQLFWEEKIEIEKRYPDLKKELTSRSSRDRIARGTMINLIPISILYWNILSFIGVLLFVLSFLMWMRFEHYNRCLELRAAYSIRQEEGRSKIEGE